MLSELRKANKARLPHFRNAKGELAHSQPDGSDWTPSQWFQALTGEVGELANWRKKYERGDITSAEFEYHAARELADIQCYLDLLAMRILDPPTGLIHPKGIDLEYATATKFNEVSDRAGSPIRLIEGADGHFYMEDRSQLSAYAREAEGYHGTD